MTSLQFPALLAGPMLRRVESSQINIWVATSKNFTITAELFATMPNSDSSKKIPTTTRTETIPFGKHLFIHLIKINPKSNSFPSNQFIGYNLHFQSEEQSFDLGDLDLLNPSNPDGIVYRSFNYPSFYIPELNSGDPQRFLYGSCRKIHGEGEDALLEVDTMLNTESENVRNRPQAIFLMGDQIYADDVPDSLFLPILEIGKSLIGAEEDLTAIDNRITTKPSIDKVNGRKEIIKNLAKFTSSNSYNHLMTFSDYAAMYFFSWSPALWKVAEDGQLLKTFEEVEEKGQLYLKSKSEKLRKLERSRLQKRYSEQEILTKKYKSTVPKMRRLLANIPSYMIFDDHDITDDWNITLDWKESVKQSPLGKHVVANGLTAFFAFQGWGNQPDAFDSAFIDTIKRHFQHLTNGQMINDYDSWIELVWQFQPWHFVAPTYPKAVFLDTRTMREYQDLPKSLLDDNGSYPPQLVNNDEFSKLTDQLKESGWVKGSPLILVSATPVIGFEFIESIVSNYVVPLQMLGVKVESVFDVEAWRYNGKGITKILNTLKKWTPNQCIILSGDVHYSFAANSSFQFSDGQRLQLKQLTSSPFNNMSFKNLGFIVKLAATIDWLKIKNQTLYRYCNLFYQIQNVDKKDLPKGIYRWQERLTYDAIEGFSIIGTDNTLGYVSITTDYVENQFLKYRGTAKT
ncbi:hypothetical protein MTP04_04610 [Lysinibacillus sp. PLM2]|nr:hypothetical protein MTP04_04610 [Lysinibacillus sp. PLM2]